MKISKNNKFTMKKDINLIFGKNGYIASNWKKQLNKKKNNTIFIGKKDCDLLKINNLKKYLNKYKSDKLNVYLISAIIRTKKNNEKSYLENMKMVKNLITALSSYNVNYFFFLSSIDVFNKSKVAITEKTLKSKSSFYARYKIESEELIRKTYNKNKIFILRIPGIYGGINDYSSTIYKIKNNILKNNKIYQNCSLRSYVFINDLISFLNIILDKHYFGNYNFCSNENYTIDYIHLSIMKKLNIHRYFLNSENETNNIYFSNNYLTKKFTKLKFTSFIKSIKYF